MSLFGGGAKKPKSKVEPRAMGIDFQGAEYGRCIPVVFGRGKVPGNVIWYGDFLATPVMTQQASSGGKGGGGGGSTTTQTGWSYSASFLVGLCEGVGSVITIFDGTTTVSTGTATLFTGTLTQSPWAHLPTGHDFAYSGTVMAGFQSLDLGSSPSLPNYNFEIAGRNQLNVGGGVFDADPKDIITAICTDTQVGVNFTTLGSMTQYSNYCKAAGILFSPVYDTQTAARTVLEELLKYSNTAAWFSEGVLKFTPYGDESLTGNGVTYTPNLTAVVDLGPNDFITNGSGPAVRIKRKSPADSANLLRLEFRDRSDTYHTSAVSASIDNDIVDTGARAPSNETVGMITSDAVGRLVAQNLIQRNYYIRNTYEFKLPWNFCYLEPMDIVTLTDANTGLSLTPVLLTEVAEDEHGLITLIAEEKPDGIAHGKVIPTQTKGPATVNTRADPGAVAAPFIFRGPGFLVTGANPEIWCAVTGVGANWAGCEVFMSNDGTTYAYVCTYARRAAYGNTTTTFANVADPDTTSTLNVVLTGAAKLLGGTASDCNNLVTLSLVGDELIAYQSATLAAGPSYNLGTRIHRGCYGTTIGSHAIGSQFTRLDENILRMPVDPSMIGKTVYIKFRSFNQFGKGGRTLAGETAYTYVVGSSVEYPDVPLTPTNIAVTPVADGVNITWTNPNPAAVGATTIVFSTASGGTYTTLAQVGPTGTAYVHHFPTGETYWYKLRARGTLPQSGWSNYSTAISSTGKFSIPSEGHNLVANPGFESNRVGTTVGASLAVNDPISDGWKVQYKDSTYIARYTQTAGRFSGGLSAIEVFITAGQSIPAGASYVQINSAPFPVVPGSVIQFGGNVQWSAGTYSHAGVSAAMYIGIQCYEEDGTVVSGDYWTTGTPPGAYSQKSNTMIVPATASKAYFICQINVNNSGSAVTVTGGQTYITANFDDLFAYQQLVSQLNLPPLNSGSISSRWADALAITSSYSTATPAVVTINVSAGVLQMGDTTFDQISYSASSGTVNQTRSTTVTYFLYYLDQAYNGGSRTLNITTDPNQLALSSAGIWIGQVDVTVPASGSGSGGTGDHGGGCVDIAAWLPSGKMAGDVHTDDVIDICDYEELSTYATKVEGASISVQPCMKLITHTGASITASKSTPMTLFDGTTVLFPDMLGRSVMVLRNGEMEWETVMTLQDVGNRPVNHIHVGGRCYWAGDDEGVYIATHNPVKP
jgi:hypothetical protein